MLCWALWLKCREAECEATALTTGGISPPARGRPQAFLGGFASERMSQAAFQPLKVTVEQKRKSETLPWRILSPYTLQCRSCRNWFWSGNRELHNVSLSVLFSSNLSVSLPFLLGLAFSSFDTHKRAHTPTHPHKHTHTQASPKRLQSHIYFQCQWKTVFFKYI